MYVCTSATRMVGRGSHAAGYAVLPTHLAMHDQHNASLLSLCAHACCDSTWRGAHRHNPVYARVRVDAPVRCLCFARSGGREPHNCAEKARNSIALSHKKQKWSQQLWRQQAQQQQEKQQKPRTYEDRCSARVDLRAPTIVTDRVLAAQGFRIRQLLHRHWTTDCWIQPR